MRPVSLNVCFSTTDLVLSRWIRWYTGSPVSHALITYRSEALGKVMVMEASGHGFRVIPWARWEQANTLTARFRLSVPPERQRHALHRIADRLGDQYDTRGLFGFVPRLGERFADKLDRPMPVRNLLDDPRRVFCSEAVAEFLYHAGFEELHTPSAWSPDDLYCYAQSEPRLEPVPLAENAPETIAKMQRQRSRQRDRTMAK